MLGVIMQLNIVKILNIHRIRYFLFKRRLKSCGKGVRFSSGIRLYRPKKISMGDNVHVGANCLFSGQGGINIGNNISFGPQVIIWSANHNFEAPERLPYDDGHICKEVNIEDNTWIGARVTIIPGIRIGEGAVVGMGSVVTKDIPSGAVVGGNPIKILKYRNMEIYNKLKEEKKFQKL